MTMKQHEQALVDAARKQERHDELTMVKVYSALMRSGLDIDQTTLAIDEMQNDGILFRERT